MTYPLLDNQGLPVQMDVPVPPATPDVVGMHRTQLSMYNWHKNTVANGAQMPFFSTDQINAMATANDLAQSGKIFYDSVANVFKAAIITGGNTLEIKTISLT